ncbi:TauD/TfdA family dioxygenase [Streptomyces sp. SKN60]|uniref:TauD/TfdA family dioxygenase n=1 Tax=Streptomyces sp. SKN60 TaxID=2855506 RepID=UPI00224638E3|nr:TauD/TfdA family dioxygenase [Streptomyces sp. SKN60]MCX2182755.1 TauD/TfdA family dioxygenase [Streptomyces sp. SKN60]
MRDGLREAEGPLSWHPAGLRTEDWLIPPTEADAGGTLPARINSALWYGAGFAVLRGLDLAGLTDRQSVELCAHLVAQVCAPAGLRLQRSANELLTATTAPALPPLAGPETSATPSGDAHLLLPHMDRGEGPEPPRLLALLCIRPAAEGGASLLASGPALHDHLATAHPDALRELHQDFRFGRGPGFDRVRPVFRHEDRTLRVHYNRYWINRGQDETGIPFTPERRAALRRMETLLQDPALVLELPLRRGDLLLVNNSAVLHGRTPFADSGAPGGRRCYARVWAD